MNTKGSLIVISGPSGCGKGTVCSRLLEKDPALKVSVSATTRDMRVGETDGVTYFFKTKEEFERMIADDALFEYTCGYSGNYYGTPKQYVFDELEKGNNVILEIEMDGAAQTKQKYPDAVLVFLAPPTMEELHARLVFRNRESAELIEERFSKARDEIKLAVNYDYIVVNDELEEAVKDIEAIIKHCGGNAHDAARAEKCKAENQSDHINELLK